MCESTDFTVRKLEFEADFGGTEAGVEGLGVLFDFLVSEKELVASKGFVNEYCDAPCYFY